MENGIEALKLAFAVLIFVIALTVAFSTYSQAKHTGDLVLKYSDREYFQELQELQEDEKEFYKVGARIVDKSTVIATIARCIKEKFTVEIIEDGRNTYKFEYDTIKSPEEIKNEFNSFITECQKTRFKETYVETIVGGKVYQGGDGTKLEENTYEKLYITYEAQ